jgi:arylsulfatase A-like enzyme
MTGSDIRQSVRPCTVVTNSVSRNILFITTDQQRYDSLGCTGGTIARTPVVDALAGGGILYHRAHNQNTVCMPSRSTMVTGQYVRTHGVVANGIPLPDDAPSVAQWLHEHGYRTALLGKAHFQPGFDRHRKWIENRMADEGFTGPYRGFEHLELALHTPGFAGFAIQHYG